MAVGYSQRQSEAVSDCLRQTGAVGGSGTVRDSWGKLLAVGDSRRQSGTVGGSRGQLGTVAGSRGLSEAGGDCRRQSETVFDSRGQCESRGQSLTVGDSL